MKFVNQYRVLPKDFENEHRLLAFKHFGFAEVGLAVISFHCNRFVCCFCQFLMDSRCRPRHCQVYSTEAGTKHVTSQLGRWCLCGAWAQCYAWSLRGSLVSLCGGFAGWGGMIIYLFYYTLGTYQNHIQVHEACTYVYRYICVHIQIHSFAFLFWCEMKSHLVLCVHIWFVWWRSTVLHWIGKKGRQRWIGICLDCVDTVICKKAPLMKSCTTNQSKFFQRRVSVALGTAVALIEDSPPRQAIWTSCVLVQQWAADFPEKISGANIPWLQVFACLEWKRAYLLMHLGLSYLTVDLFASSSSKGSKNQFFYAPKGRRTVLRVSKFRRFWDLRITDVEPWRLRVTPWRFSPWIFLGSTARKAFFSMIFL